MFSIANIEVSPPLRWQRVQVGKFTRCGNASGKYQVIKTINAAPLASQAFGWLNGLK